MTQSPPPVLVLASASPRRHELLARLGLPFEIRVSAVDESAIPAPNPLDYALAAAREKCRDVARNLGRPAVVLGSDTVVCLHPDAGDESPVDAHARAGSRILGKPADAAEAVRMLSFLSGRRHAVITAVAVQGPGGRLVEGAAVSGVTFRPLSRAVIEAYVSGGEPLDKAGAYAIQGGAAGFVTRLEGGMDNVIGLPLQLVAGLLSEFFPGLAPRDGSADARENP